MSHTAHNWQYTETIHREPEHTQRARKHALEHGVAPISVATGAQLASIAAMSNSRTIAEIGTGMGVSGLWLLSAHAHSTLTTIDVESEYQRHAKRFFTEAGISTPRLRFINGNAQDVLPRMNENTYDLVFLDADTDSILEYVEHGLRLVRPGGTVLIPRILQGGKLADPNARDTRTQDYRALMSELTQSTAVTTALSPVGDGLLSITRTLG